MTINQLHAGLLLNAYDRLNDAFRDLPLPPDAQWQTEPWNLEPSALARVLQATAVRLQDNYPYHHPNYAGQMLKPPHPLAQLAYTLAQSINPNNHALDGGRASSAMEKEAVAHIARMLGFRDRHLGHLCSGGTVANLEALWVARERTPPGSRVLSSEFSHYTHARLSGVLGVAHSAVAADSEGRMCLDALRCELDKGDVGTVVATLGTTAYGSIDPLAEIVGLKGQYGFRLHVDAAYGGYFSLLPDLPKASDFGALGAADSIVIDPHKHGLQPYGCGCVLFADPADGVVYAHDSPYTYFSSDDLHLGEISLECSRAGAAAVALWATQQALPNRPDSQFAAGLSECRQAAVRFHGWLAGSKGWLPLLEPDLDIVVWAPAATTMSQASALSKAIFDALAKRDIHIALVKVPASFVSKKFPQLAKDADSLTCMRVCLMKPEHNRWLGGFLEELKALEALPEPTLSERD